MTQLLSLETGNISPPGLSGGANPLSGRGPSFADLLAAHAANGAKQPTLPAGMQAAAAVDGGFEGTLPHPKGLPAPATPPGAFASAQSTLGPDTQPQPPQSQSPKAILAAMTLPMPAYAPLPSTTSPDGAVVQAPAPEGALPDGLIVAEEGEAAPAELPGSACEQTIPLQANPPAADTPAPSARELAPVAVATGPAEPAAGLSQPETALEAPQPATLQVPDEGIAANARGLDRNDETPAFTSPAAQPAAAGTAPAAIVAAAAGIAGPTDREHAAHRPATAGGDGQAVAVSRADEQPRMAASERAPASPPEMSPARPSSGPSTGPSPASGGTADFGTLVEAPSGEVAAPALDSGSPTGELLAQTRTDPLRGPGAPHSPASLPHGTVSARPGEIGQQLGLEIVRNSLDGKDSLTIRLDPVEMGEIQIRLQFDDRGTMRAHVVAESAAALEMLRRDSGDLVRALGDAGVRTDAQSFQFESRGHNRGEQQGHNARPDTPAHRDASLAELDTDDQSLPPHKLRSSGSLDFFA
ncbi:flagellar hook-length control protein FliK [Alteriqipengyuania sp. 357]